MRLEKSHGETKKKGFNQPLFLKLPHLSVIILPILQLIKIMNSLIKIGLLLLTGTSTVFAQTSKKMLVEHFTNTKCSICASLNPGFYANECTGFTGAFSEGPIGNPTSSLR